MGGILYDKIREEYALPEGYEPVTVLAIGYYGDESAHSDAIQERNAKVRSRKALGEIAFAGGVGEAFGLEN